MRTAEGRACRILGQCYPAPSEQLKPGETMNLTTDHLADILIGVARAQNAVIDAMERASPGFRNTHALPLITLAANMRAGDPRMIDLSARILMRLQGRVALDNAQVKADLERLMSGKPAPAAAPAAAKPAAAPAANAGGLDFSKP
jgi:hypothetical protein